MVFVVANECQQLGLRAGAVVFRGLDVGPRTAALHAEISQEVARVLVKYPTAQALRSAPEVAAFHAILPQFGVNPRKVQPSIEKLWAFARKRNDLPAINSLVDAYNLLSLRSLCSLGTHDLDRIAPPVSLRVLTGTETFTPLGKDAAEPVVAGEFGYVDAAHRLLCRLDVLQADFSRVTDTTQNALLIVEGTSAHAPEVLRQTVSDAMVLIVRHCGGTAEVSAWPGVNGARLS